MKLGYMTNAFGPLVGMGGGVTSMKEAGYLTMCNDEEAIKTISLRGYKYIEIFEGNIGNYEKNPEVLKEILDKYNVSILGVYTGCHLIYQDALGDELYKVNRLCDVSQKLGVKHIVLGGGSIRGEGIQEGDFALAAMGINEVAKVIKSHGMIPSYHPHLGSIAETPEQIHKLFALTDIAFCPDIAHLAAGGGDALELIRQYYERIKYVHLKDLSETGEFVPLGKGKIDLEAIINFLKEKDYQGDWLVEIDGYSGEPNEACEISYEYLKGKLI